MVMVMKYLSSNRWKLSRANIAVVHDVHTTTIGSSTASHRGRFHTNSLYNHVLYLKEFKALEMKNFSIIAFFFDI